MPFAAMGATLAGTATSAQLATTALTLGATGIGLQVAGQVQAGREARAQGKSQEALREYNARLAEREAREARDVAAFEERRLRKGGERLKATQRARIAKAGVTFEGSPLEAMEQTATELETDALLIRRGGLIGAQRFTAEAALSRVAGRSALLRGKAKRRAATIGAFATGLGGAAQVGLTSFELKAAKLKSGKEL